MSPNLCKGASLQSGLLPMKFGRMYQHPIHKGILFFLLASLLLIGCSRKPTVFRGFSDGTMAWWSLNLYVDGGFDMHLGGGDYAGEYRVDGDTIWLQYLEEPAKGTGPRAFLIDRRKAVVVGLRMNAATQGLALDKGTWMEIVEDGLRQ
jgi:hypothetical protein